MKKSFFLMATLLLGIAAFQSCRKSESNSIDVTTTEDLATNEDFSEEIDFATDIAIEERGGSGGCPTVTLDKPWGTWPNTLTIDYGTTGCSGPNGDHILKGKIVITQTDDMFSAGATRTKTFDNFYIDDVKVSGSKSWTNNGLDSAGHWSYTKTATNMELGYPDGTSTTWNHTHTSTLTSGALTLTFWDNVWSTTGNSSGTNRNGVNYTSTITEPLIKKGGCRWISEGQVEIIRDGNTSTLDFGDGACDRFATLTLPNGDQVTIKLRK